MRRLLVLLLAWLFVFGRASLALAQEGGDESADEAGGEAAAPEEAPGDVVTRGMDCIPQVTEVEARRPIPITCDTDEPATKVELRYRREGVKKWSKLSLKETDSGWAGEIPCAETAQLGPLKVYVFARNEEGKVSGRVGKKSKPMEINIVETSKQKPPALPNQSPPDRCFSASECPPEMLGTSACPGTKKGGAAAKLAWGSSCNKTSDCKSGLACVSGSCETPPKCDVPDDCASGECVEGVCHFPDPEEVAERLGPEMHHWFGLHFGVDLAFVPSALGVCGTETADSESYSCFEAGNPYTGTPNARTAGSVDAGPYLATMRVLFSYEYVFKRFAIGARAGFAFRGAPEDFSPVHFEARLLYALTKDVLNKRFRPYLGIAAGYAQVDAAVPVVIGDCGTPADPACVTAPDPDGVATKKELDAYRSSGRVFFGPTFNMLFAFSNESGLTFSVNAMLPQLVLEPVLGYTLAF